ncbi:hypothetical protein HK405_012520, partial [Cladochytrium tenue]
MARAGAAAVAAAAAPKPASHSLLHRLPPELVAHALRCGGCDPADIVRFQAASRACRAIGNDAAVWMRL